MTTPLPPEHGCSASQDWTERCPRFIRRVDLPPARPTLFCPAGVETLLWYHARCEPIHESGVHRQYTELLLEEECIKKDESSGSGYRTTEKGKFMVEMICQTPFPETIFRDPRQP